LKKTSKIIAGVAFFALEPLRNLHWEEMGREKAGKMGNLIKR
jgi:hypothetical protein